MKRIPIAVAASILAAAGLCAPAQALPRSLPYGAHAGVPASLLLPARYHRHRHYRRHDRRDEEAAAQPTDADAAAIKPGQWEFAAQLEAAALPSPGSTAAPDAAAIGGGGATKTAYAICVDADKAVPSAFVAGCRVDGAHRDGGRITWSMTCTNRQNAVRSDGVAQYRGDTMTATMVSHLPSAKAGGKTIDVAQYITGHYLGPCPTAGAAGATASGAAASAAAAPAATTAAPAATATAPAAGAPALRAAAPAATTAATPSAAVPAEGTASASREPEASTAAPPAASAAPPAEEHAARHRRYRRHRRHYAYRRHRYGGGYFGGGYSGFGPNPYSANGY